MTTLCPNCRKLIEIVVTHQGVSSDGVYQRATLEATHADPCDGWKATEHNLIPLAAEAT